MLDDTSLPDCGPPVTPDPGRRSQDWSPGSWRRRPRSQHLAWPDPVALDAVTDALRRQPAVVPAGRVHRLRQRLAGAVEHRRSVLQAGPCAESFRDDPRIAVDGLADLLSQLAAALSARDDGDRTVAQDVVCLARAAGQYAKPRSSDVEICGGRSVPVFRGHLVHDDTPVETARRPDPRRLLTGHARSCDTVARLRAVAPEVFVSHEALLLEYEEALVRRDPITGGWYAGSGDLLWVGERTRGIEEAHVEFLAGIPNPVACKLGPSTSPEEVVELCARLDPQRSAGRLTLVPRLGADRVGDVLPGLVRAVASAGHPVAWLCDPMHGNTRTGPHGKWRAVPDLRAEIHQSWDVHASLGSWLAGLHLEVTAEDVTECSDGDELPDAHLPRRATSLCDPRLNPAQARTVVGSLLAAASAATR